MPGVWRFAWNTSLDHPGGGLHPRGDPDRRGHGGPAQAAFWRMGGRWPTPSPSRPSCDAGALQNWRLRAESTTAMWRLAPGRLLAGGGLGGRPCDLAPQARRSCPPVLGRGSPAGRGDDLAVGAAVIGILALPLEPMLISLGKPGWRCASDWPSGRCSWPYCLGSWAFGLIGAGAKLVPQPTAPLPWACSGSS
jgi:hypothetical protein